MRLAGWVAFAWAACVAPAMADEALVVSFSHEIKPDAALLEFTARLHALGSVKGKTDIAAVEAMFAPRVRAFTRGLDPFQPWHRVGDLSGDYLTGTANVMVEQGELEAGMPVPDYRIEAARQLAGLVDKGAVFGSLKEAPGSVCAPAAYKVDREAALAFARKFELDAYSLRFYARDVTLRHKPGQDADSGTIVPAGTLMMFDYDPKAPEGWGKYETSNGVSGYMNDEGLETLGLSQHHVCFGKVNGKYRIKAVFGYGL